MEEGDKIDFPEEYDPAPEGNNPVPQKNVEEGSQRVKLISRFSRHTTGVSEEEASANIEIAEWRYEMEEGDKIDCHENDPVPEESYVVPEETDSVPEENDSVPEENDSIPEENDSVPEENDSVPEENDSVPEENDSVPEENITVSEQNVDEGSKQMELISSFQNATGVSEEEARNELEIAEWKYELAITNHYGEEPELYEVPIVKGSEAFPKKEKRTRKGFPSKRKDRTESPPMNGTAKRQELNEGSSNRIVTFSTLSEEEDDNAQAFYAGGSVHSGQQVLGHSTRGFQEFLQDMMVSARSHGAIVVQGNRDTSETVPFQGHGYILGYSPGNQIEVPEEERFLDVHMEVDKEEDSLKSSSPELERIPPSVIQVYRNGLVINGQFCNYQDRKTNAYVGAMAMGQMPGPRQENDTNVIIEDHSGEYFVIPQIVPFSGVGYRLGSPTPNPSGADYDGEQTFDKKEKSVKKEQLVVNENLPSTTIQIRLVDGSRMSMTLNLSHTIQDIMNQIVLVNPEYVNIPFELLTGFPPRLLVNLCSTIEEEKLSNSVLIIKRKR